MDVNVHGNCQTRCEPTLQRPAMMGEESRKGFSLTSRNTQTQGICWLVGCLTSQHHASVSQRRICSDNCTCCHTEIEVAHQTCYPTQSQCTDTGPTSPSADSITLGAWQGSHWSANFEVTSMTTRKNPHDEKWESNPRSAADAITTRQTRGPGRSQKIITEICC